MNYMKRIRERIGMGIGAAIGAIFFFGFGALMVFVLSPRQALLARHISRMPDMDATTVAVAETGDDVLITGRLADNAALNERFVAYILQEWEVTPADPEADDDEPDGKWVTREHVLPDLLLEVNGKAIRVLEADGIAMSGTLHEVLIRSNSEQAAKHDGEWLPEGSLRMRGFFNGDLTTVLGKKASNGDIVPQELYAGDRVAFAESKRQAARGMFIGGLCAMGTAPIVLVLGILGALFGRRRRRRW